jgi:hypothetical protein
MNPITRRYKIPLLIALVVGLAVIALSRETYWLNAVYAFLGAIAGIFLIDLEYIVHAYGVDSSSEKSKTLKDFTFRKDYNGLIAWLNENEYSFGELSIRSALFQIVLVIFALYVVTTQSFILGQTLVLSVFANLVYVQIMELNKTGSLQRWFWVYTGQVGEKFYNAYLFLMIIMLVWLFVLI